MPTERQKKHVLMRGQAPVASTFDERVAALGPVLWLDMGSAIWADTAGTVPATVGGAVGRWDDRSGNERHAVGNGAIAYKAAGISFEHQHSYFEVTDTLSVGSLPKFTYLIRFTPRPQSMALAASMKIFSYGNQWRVRLVQYSWKVDVSFAGWHRATAGGFDRGRDMWMYYQFDDSWSRPMVKTVYNQYLRTLAITTNYPAAITPPEHNLRIGHDAIPFYPGTALQGEITSFIVFPEVLTDTDIRLLMIGETA